MKCLYLFGFFGVLALVFKVDAISIEDSDQQALEDYVTEFLRPYAPKIRQWFWEISGSSTPSSRLQTSQSRADFITCDICVNGMPLVKDFLKTNIPEEVIIGIISAACIALNLAPRADICEPTIRSYATSVLYILKTKPDMLESDFCGVLNPGCTQLSDRYSNWEIRINNVKPLVDPVPFVPSNTASTKILQFTDVHLDLDYKENRNASCGLPICCRETDLITDPTNETVVPSGKFGDFSCGLPSVSLQAMFDHAKENHNDAKFIFLTGDYVHSGVWLYSREENGRHIASVTNMLQETFKDTGAIILPLTGNHEPDVVNMYPPVPVWGDFNLTWMYEKVSEPFSQWIPDTQLSLFKKYGYYTVTPKEHPFLRIIAINTNICYINNFWLPYDPIDTFGQLQWFADTLDMAEKQGQNVLVIGHIQPGSGSCWPVWSHQFNRIINRYEGIIRGQFYGHSHEQYYTLAFEDKTEKPISVSFVAGSALTDGMNSAYNVYHADGERGDLSTWEIMNQETFILNLNKSNTNLDKEPVFEKILDAKSDFGVKSLRPQEVYDFINRMICDENLFQKYQQISLKGKDSPRLKPCINDTICKSNILGDYFVSNSNDRSHQTLLENTILSGEKCVEKGKDSGANSLQIPFISVLFLSLVLIY